MLNSRGDTGQAERYSLLKEAQLRSRILQELLNELDTDDTLTARELSERLAQRGVHVPKRVINSVLFTEGKRYIRYDVDTYKYGLRARHEVKRRGYEGVHLPEPESPVLSSSGQEQQVPAASDHLEASLIDDNAMVRVVARGMSGPALFVRYQRGSKIVLELNSQHPWYQQFERQVLSTVGGQTANGEPTVAAKRLLFVLLLAWSEFEEREPEGVRRQRAEDARVGWSRHVKRVLARAGQI